MLDRSKWVAKHTVWGFFSSLHSHLSFLKSFGIPKELKCLKVSKVKILTNVNLTASKGTAM